MSHEPFSSSQPLHDAPRVEAQATARTWASDWMIALGIGIAAGLVMAATKGHKITGHKSALLMFALTACSQWAGRRGTFLGAGGSAVGTCALLVGTGGLTLTLGFASLLAEFLRFPLTGARNPWLRSVLGGLVCAMGYVFKNLVLPEPAFNQMLGLSGHFFWGALGMAVAEVLIHRMKARKE